MTVYLPYGHKAIDKAYRLWVDDRQRESLSTNVCIFDNWLEEKFGMTLSSELVHKDLQIKYWFNNENERLMFLLKYS